MYPRYLGALECQRRRAPRVLECQILPAAHSLDLPAPFTFTGTEELERHCLHVDESSFDSFHYSCVLYLSSEGKHFDGGQFIFSDPPSSEHQGSGGMPAATRQLSSVSPAMGMGVVFSSGWENVHQVRVHVHVHGHVKRLGQNPQGVFCMQIDVCMHMHR